MIEHPELLSPGTKIRWGYDRTITYTIMRRTEGNRGWYLDDDSVVEDHVLCDGPWYVVGSPAYTQIFRVTTDVPQSKVLNFVLCDQCGAVVGDSAKHNAFHGYSSA